MSHEPSGTGAVSRPSRKPVSVPNGGGCPGCARSRRRSRAPARRRRRRPPRPCPWGGRSRPAVPPRAPAATTGRATQPPRRRRASRAVRCRPLPYEDEPRDACRVHLGDLHGHVVQPLVGEQQPGDPLRGLGRPLDAGIEPYGTVGELDAVGTHACGHMCGERGEHPGHQLAAAGAQVHEVQGGRTVQRLVHPAQQPGHGAREERRRVHRRTEVSGGPLGPAVEALGPVEGLLGRRPPAAPPARGVFRHVVRLSAQDNGASTLGVRRTYTDRSSG